jgi:hypothetical protein
MRVKNVSPFPVAVGGGQMVDVGGHADLNSRTPEVAAALDRGVLTRTTGRPAPRRPAPRDVSEPEPASQADREPEPAGAGGDAEPDSEES